MNAFSIPNQFSNIKLANSALQVLELLQNIPCDSTIFLDIDDTLITPVSKTFRLDPHRKIIDQIKQNSHLYTNYVDILSNWRLQRKVMLVDKNWPKVINQLKEKYQVYGLTKADSGKFGNIESMEQWRYNELSNLNLILSHNDVLEKHIINSKKINNNPSFYKGIFLTGADSKSNVLNLYSKMLNLTFVVLIDDRKEQLEDLEIYCRQKGLPFLGILFKGTDYLPGIPNIKVVNFQREYLIKNAKWLEDEEVEYILSTHAK